MKRFRKPNRTAKRSQSKLAKAVRLKTKRLADARKAITQRAKMNITREDADSALAFLESKLGLPKGSPPALALNGLIENQVAQKLVLVSHEKHYEALDIILAGATVLASLPDDERDHEIGYLCKKTATESKRTSPLALLARAYIDYGKDEDGKPTPGAVRSCSRDVGALSWLQLKHEEVKKCGGVVGYQSAHKGGVDDWHRFWAAHKKIKSKTVDGNIGAPDGEVHKDAATAIAGNSPDVVEPKTPLHLVHSASAAGEAERQVENAPAEIQEIKPKQDGLVYNGDAALLTVVPDTDAPGGFRIIDTILLPLMSEALIKSKLLPRVRNLAKQVEAHRVHELNVMAGTAEEVEEDFYEDEFEVGTQSEDAVH